MRQLHARRALAVLPLSLALTLSTAVAVSAQVATLTGPDATPSEAPQETQADLEFADREEALLAYAQCMRDNGIDMDDPVGGTPGGRGFFRGGPGGSDNGFDPFSDDFGAAQQACGDILEAARPEIDPAAEQERLEQQLALAQCYRDNGYPEYPDPVIGTDGRNQRGGSQFDELGIDPRSEAFQEVRATCAEQLGVEAFGVRGGFGPGAPGGD